MFLGNTYLQSTWEGDNIKQWLGATVRDLQIKRRTDTFRYYFDTKDGSQLEQTT